MNDQGTDAWKIDRLGHVTASRMRDVLATIKSGEAATRANYRAELVAQRLTGVIENGFTNAAMEWGTLNEPMARAAYELKTNCMVEEVGFIKHPTIKWSGASPDGLIDDDGLVEIKCPNTKTHINYLVAGKPPPDYVPQMIWQMACTGRKWCDFASYDPRMPEDMRLFIVRLLRNDDLVIEYENSVKVFVGEIESTIAKLMAITRPEPTAYDYINTP